MPEIEFALWTELLVNAFAVLLGGIGALALARWRMKRESAAEKQRAREHLASRPGVAQFPFTLERRRS